jgi:protein-ribulosamine 3-kinase
MFKTIDRKISDSLHINYQTKKSISIGGGCINQSYKIFDEENIFFVKINSLDLYNMFIQEAYGLEQIIKNNSIRAPKVICYGTDKNISFLVLEYINLQNKNCDKQLGGNLAKMHAKRQQKFGFDNDNYIGSTEQINTFCDNWIEFYKENRLLKQLKISQQKSNAIDAKNLIELCDRLDIFFVDYTPYPTLLHGDLWAGNYACDENKQPVIFDPACYYGDREADIAMSELFGGFDSSFYKAYNDTLPLDDGYKTRKKLYNLYHILNHYNLFGGSYANTANRIINELLEF